MELFNNIDFSNLGSECFESKYPTDEFTNRFSYILESAGLYRDIINIIFNYMFIKPHSIIFSLTKYLFRCKREIPWQDNKNTISGKIFYSYSFADAHYHYRNVEIDLGNCVNIIFGNDCKLLISRYSCDSSYGNMDIFDSNMNLISNSEYMYLHQCNDFLKKIYEYDNKLISKIKSVENSEIFKKIIVIRRFRCKLTMFYFKDTTNLHYISAILKHLEFIINNNYVFNFWKKKRKYPDS
jgi:hypothetical protein